MLILVLPLFAILLGLLYTSSRLVVVVRENEAALPRKRDQSPRCTMTCASEGLDNAGRAISDFAFVRKGLREMGTGDRARKR